MKMWRIITEGTWDLCKQWRFPMGESNAPESARGVQHSFRGRSQGLLSSIPRPTDSIPFRMAESGGGARTPCVSFTIQIRAHWYRFPSVAFRDDCLRCLPRTATPSHAAFAPVTLTHIQLNLFRLAWRIQLWRYRGGVPGYPSARYESWLSDFERALSRPAGAPANGA